MVPCKSAQAFCRLGWIPKKVVVREALAVYVKGSGGAAAEEPTPGRTRRNLWPGPPAEEQDTAAFWEPEQRVSAPV